MRVNIEEDLWSSGRLRKLARITGLDEHAALGRLVCVYRRTQEALIASASIDRIHTLVCVDFDSDDEARRFLFAMAGAQLADISADVMTIRGNEKHVERFEKHKNRSVNGGKRSSQNRQQFREPPVDRSSTARSTVAQPAVNTPISDLRSPEEDLRSSDLFPQHRDQSKILDSRPAQKARKPVTEDSPMFARVVDCWFVHHREVYGDDPPWGALQGKQLSAVMRKAKGNGAELLDLIPQFFHGPYPDSITAGHPLSDGYASLAMRVAMLRADLSKPERRVDAARFAHRIRDATQQVGTQDEYAKALEAMARDDEQKKLEVKNGIA